MEYRVKAVRELKEWSLTDTATASGLDRTTIHRIEQCSVRGRRSTIIALARGLGISSRRLWDLHMADLAERTLIEHDVREATVV